MGTVTEGKALSKRKPILRGPEVRIHLPPAECRVRIRLVDGRPPHYRRNLIPASWNAPAIRVSHDLCLSTSPGRDRCGLCMTHIATVMMLDGIKCGPDG